MTGENIRGAPVEPPPGPPGPAPPRPRAPRPLRPTPARLMVIRGRYCHKGASSVIRDIITVKPRSVVDHLHYRPDAVSRVIFQVILAVAGPRVRVLYLSGLFPMRPFLSRGACISDPSLPLASPHRRSMT
ncbi:unnamed protein product [Danaus chrysippus]|uniref:(African queen) hypothetical protein n=1 Tax=Danaus chrysippus TaxID=151541 RepID=A0A8J2QY53_9NEOP|nr:unnamed protein product [Danaus chrysippus]